MPTLDDSLNLTIEDDGSFTLVVSDQGISIAAAHAPSHASGGSDPITIANTQVTGLGTMSTQAANDVSIVGGEIDNTTIGQTTPNLGSFSEIDAPIATLGAASISALSLTTDLAILHGGTGASSAPAARTNLGLGTIATQAANSVSITGGTISGITDLAIADGGTGAGDAPTARTNLGLGTIATQAANNVTITGGTISGITDLAIADGGTGASSAPAARTSLFVPAVTDTTRWRSDITALTGGASNALDSIDISNTTTWPTRSSIAFSVSGELYVYLLTDTGEAESSPDIIRPDSYGGREWTLISDSGVLPISEGGTGASTDSGARTSLGLEIGADVQAYNANLSALSGLTGLADRLPYFTGAGAMSLANFGSFARTLLANTTAEDALADLGIRFGLVSLVAGTITHSVPGADSGSHIFAVHAGPLTVAVTGHLVATPGTDQITITSYTSTGSHAIETQDRNNVFYLVII